MSDKIILNEIQPIEYVKQAYSGKPGCACGCRGKYYFANVKDVEDWRLDYKDQKKNSLGIRRIYRLFQENLHTGRVYTYKEYENDYAILNLHEGRTYTLHYKD
jgi:hypothetical protein